MTNLRSFVKVKSLSTTRYVSLYIQTLFYLYVPVLDNKSLGTWLGFGLDFSEQCSLVPWVPAQKRFHITMYHPIKSMMSSSLGFKSELSFRLFDSAWGLQTGQLQHDTLTKWAVYTRCYPYTLTPKTHSQGLDTLSLGVTYCISSTVRVLWGRMGTQNRCPTGDGPLKSQLWKLSSLCVERCCSICWGSRHGK